MRYKEPTVDECIEFVQKKFDELTEEGGGIATECFWDMAQSAGLWRNGIFNGPMTKALERLVTVETVQDADGNFAYNAFCLKK